MVTAGRPPKFTSPDDMQVQIDLYFVECEEKGNYPTVMGMALFLGFCDAQSLLDYQLRKKNKTKFAGTLKRAKTRIFESKMQSAARGEMDKTIFIFDAVNNHGMFNTRTDNRNKTELKAKTETTVKIEFVGDDDDS